MNFFSTYLGKIIATFFISMVPVIELRGAIPFGVSIGLDVWTVSILAIIGNIIPTPFIILFIRKIFEWLRSKSDRLNKLVSRLEAKADKHKAKVTRYEFWGLCLFVAIPLPGTGAWTGALIAAMLEMRLKDAIPSIFLGVVIAAIIMGLSSYLVATGMTFLFF
ncbi:MAG: small multi-drug export protein [Clostridia bacterium]|nr:small multi-drug export protein [Clostridia bacterium]